MATQLQRSWFEDPAPHHDENVINMDRRLQDWALCVMQATAAPVGNAK